MAENVTYDFLDDEGVRKLAIGILSKVNERINKRIVQELNPNDLTHVPSAAAVYKAIRDSRHTKIQTVTGDINVIVPLEDRSTSILYFQRDNEEDTTWMIYIWNADPDLHPDPNGEWICLGDTEIDLSGYWSKDESDVLELKQVLGVNALEDRVSNIEDILPTKVNHSDMHAITMAEVEAILDDAYDYTKPYIDGKDAETPAAVQDIFDALVAEGGDHAIVNLTKSMDLSDPANKIIIPAGVDAEINLLNDVVITADSSNAFVVNDGSSLTLNGRGTIVKTGKNSSGAIQVENGGELIIDGPTIDCTTQGAANNFAYGIYAKNNSVVTFKSGKIKTAFGCCIGTNNTVGGSTINILGGEMYCDGSYAIYNAAQGTINIFGGKIQGINARMGTINITGDAEIIPTTITAESYDDIGTNIATSGCIWFGDTIALIVGTYSDPNGVDAVLNIGESVKVDSNFRSAIGVYCVDTKEAANVTVNVANGDNVKTTDVSADAIKVYDHAYIAAAATAAGKTFNPIVASTVTVTVDETQVYPAA